jgi:hypothetical protein
MLCFTRNDAKYGSSEMAHVWSGPGAQPSQLARGSTSWIGDSGNDAPLWWAATIPPVVNDKRWSSCNVSGSSDFVRILIPGSVCGNNRIRLLIRLISNCQRQNITVCLTRSDQIGLHLSTVLVTSFLTWDYTKRYRVPVVLVKLCWKSLNYNLTNICSWIRNRLRYFWENECKDLDPDLHLTDPEHSSFSSSPLFSEYRYEHFSLLPPTRSQSYSRFSLTKWNNFSMKEIHYFM